MAMEGLDMGNDGNRVRVGLSDISLHIPRPMMDLGVLVDQRVREIPALDRHLQRAVRTTGQRAFRFPEPWEDTATMAAQAVLALVRRDSVRDPARVRHLLVGTESGVDHSKPVSAYVQGMLDKAGAGLPRTLTSAQVQHACAGGTVALLGAAGLLAAAGRDGEVGIVACTDIARYQLKSTAEVTQGAGAAALLVERNPRLVELDLETMGLCSRDVDDFFRPLGSTTAQVNGSYSMKCYTESLDAALADHAERRGVAVQTVLQDADLFVLHTPFHNMPGLALRKVLEKRLALDEAQAAAFLQEKGFLEGIDPLADVGNLYTGSLFAALASLLQSTWKRLGDGIVGREILFASYGSGSTMMVFSGRVAAGAPQVIAGWGALFGSARPATFDEYAAWAQGPEDAARYAADRQAGAPPAGVFHLASIRKDGYHDYGWTGDGVAADGGAYAGTGVSAADGGADRAAVGAGAAAASAR
jgi:hydroxymethylglutaryl-CoA synthase